MHLARDALCRPRLQASWPFAHTPRTRLHHSIRACLATEPFHSDYIARWHAYAQIQASGSKWRCGFQGLAWIVTRASKVSNRRAEESSNVDLSPILSTKVRHIAYSLAAPVQRIHRRRLGVCVRHIAVYCTRYSPFAYFATLMNKRTLPEEPVTPRLELPNARRMQSGFVSMLTINNNNNNNPWLLA